MSKIVSAVNSMISNVDKITEVRRGNASNDELFFLYDGKYTWSIYLDTDEDCYYIHYYPSYSSTGHLAVLTSWDDVEYITYSTDTLKTREAEETFAELYRVLKEKIYDVGKVLDDIIDDMKN